MLEVIFEPVVKHKGQTSEKVQTTVFSLEAEWFHVTCAYQAGSSYTD